MKLQGRTVKKINQKEILHNAEVNSGTHCHMMLRHVNEFKTQLNTVVKEIFTGGELLTAHIFEVRGERTLEL